MITTVIISANRPELLQRCLNSLLGENTSIFVLINGNDAASFQICEKFNVPVLTLKTKVTPAEARNIAVKNIATEWIHFLDDDAFIDPGFYQQARLTIQNSNADVVGGPNLTPQNSNYFQNISGLALESFWGAGPCHKRYSSDFKTGSCEESSLILCNLFIRRKIFELYSFPQHFYCGEENSLLATLKKNNYTFITDPGLYVWHERRGNLRGFLTQIWKYGVGRGQNILKSFDFNFFHLIPLVSITLFSIFIFERPLWLKGLIGVYVSLNLIFSVLVAERFKKSFFKSFSLLFVLFPMIHFFYALGCVSGLLTLNNIFEGWPLIFKTSKLPRGKNL